MLSVNTLQLKKDNGDVRAEWLFTGSDDNTIRIWDMKTQACLDELIGHTNGVLSLAFANNCLFSGSYDNFMIVWDLEEVEKKIIEI